MSRAAGTDGNSKGITHLCDKIEEYQRVNRTAASNNPNGVSVICVEGESFRV
jgi:hypothetical protein